MAGILKMGTVQLESSDGLKVASLTHGTDDIIALNKRLKVEGKEVGSPILAEYEVTGSAVTSIDFSGLDINAHGGSYEIEFRLINVTASTVLLYAFVNNDTTNVNYYSQNLNSGATAVNAGRANDARLTSIFPSATSFTISQIGLVNNAPVGVSKLYTGPASTLYTSEYTWSKTATVTNITQLTFTASVASSIGVGSKIIIRRKDK